MLHTTAALAHDFSTLFNFLPIGAYRTSATGEMLRANPSLVRMNGFHTEADMLESVNRLGRLGASWYVEPGRRALFQALIAREGQVRGFVSEVVRHPGGEHLWVSENAHAVRDAQGRVLYYEGTVEDITDNVRAEQALRRSEEQLRQVTGQMPGMVFVMEVLPDGQRAFQFVSPGVRDLYGIEPDELMRDASLAIRALHPDDADRVLTELAGMTGRSAPLSSEFRIVCADGSVKWLHRRSSGVSSDASGRLRLGVVLDITERKQTELALRESEALWRLALESAGDGVWDWNLQSGEEFLSPSIKAMFGYTDDDLGATVDALDQRTHPDDVPAMEAARQAHFEGRTPLYRNEHRVRCKDGRWKWVLSRGVVIARDAQGRPLRMVGTHTDVTEYKQAEAQQRALEAQLRESQKMEAIGTLAGGVAHDFNNLLAAILGNLALAREDVGPQDHAVQESLQEIHRAAIRARQLVQQILTFSRRQTQEFQHQPLTPLVAEALGLLRSLLPAGVRLTTRLPSAELRVLCDATQVQQVLMNLCTNAWQTYQGKGGEVTVALQAQVLDPAQAEALGLSGAGPHACLSVIDSGPGMDAETQRRIFEPFFTTKAPGTGTGLGLAVVHGIVKAHRGAIAVRSHPGEGARFDVYLPVACAPGGEPLPCEPVPAAAPAVAPGRHVVYIDDYEAMVFLVGRLLRKRGYRASTFESGEAALAWLREHPHEAVDLVLTDQNMPGLSGVEVAAALRRQRPELPVAIISGHVNEQLLQDASAAGVREVLGKQDNMEALADAMGALLERMAPPARS